MEKHKEAEINSKAYSCYYILKKQYLREDKLMIKDPISLGEILDTCLAPTHVTW